MSHKEEEPVKCYLCTEVPWYELGLAFPELEDQPLLCSRCVFEQLTGKRLKWKKRDSD